MKKLSPAAQAEFNALAAEFPTKQSALLMTLRLVEKEFGCIDNEAVELAASLCEVPPSHVLGMVTFYTHFKRPAHGKHRFMVCSTLMCSIGGSEAVLEKISQRLGIKPGERTKDGLFSLEKVECLADCDKPAVIQVDNDHHNHLTQSNVDELIDRYLKIEGKTDSDYRIAGEKMDLSVPYVPVKHSAT